MQYIYTKGQFLPADAPFITADDRSFRFGDGIFETILVADGKMWDAAAHFSRLKNGLEFLRVLFSGCESDFARRSTYPHKERMASSQIDLGLSCEPSDGATTHGSIYIR